MSVCLIEPRDTLLVRDARPFGAGARAVTLDFPFPSTLAGAVRSRLGRDSEGLFDKSRIQELLTQSVRGPFLVEVSDAGEVKELLVPAPFDAVLFEQEGRGAVRRQLRPLRLPTGSATDLENFSLVGLSPPEKRKPLQGAPRFWPWSRYQEWLIAPRDGQSVQPSELGCMGPLRESRTHVTVDPQRGAAEDHKLFQTEGLRFSQCREGRLSQELRLGLAIETGQAEALRGVGAMGGERRLMAWRPVKWALPDLPSGLVQSVEKHRALRLVLVTPAFFEEGWHPGELLLDKPLELVGAIVPRAEVVAGWDLAAGQARPSRRLAPAGSVYFFGLAEGAPVRETLESLWLRSVSDTEQARLDGFGLAVVGSWDGQLASLEGGA